MAKFDVVLSLTETTGFKETADAEDLRTLASGFIDLGRGQGRRTRRAQGRGSDVG